MKKPTKNRTIYTSVTNEEWQEAQRYISFYERMSLSEWISAQIRAYIATARKRDPERKDATQ